MNDQQGQLLPLTTPAPVRRVLPVVVFGETVIQPLRFPDPLVLQIEEGKSYRAMVEAMRGDGEVLLVFVSEPELAGFRSSVPQLLPTVGVIARVQEVNERRGTTHRIQTEGLSRADILTRVDHAPFYRAACVPHPDPITRGAAVESLMRQVKQQVADFARQVKEAPALHLLTFVNNIQEPGVLADVCAAGPMFSFQERLALLQTYDPMVRLRMVKQKLGITHI